MSDTNNKLPSCEGRTNFTYNCYKIVYPFYSYRIFFTLKIWRNLWFDKISSSNQPLFLIHLQDEMWDRPIL